MSKRSTLVLALIASSAIALPAQAIRLGGDAQIAYNVSFQGVKRSVPEASMGALSLAIGGGLLLKRKLG
jgi:hypothetical protein